MDFGLWKWGHKKRLNRVNKCKTICKSLFLPQLFYTLYEQKFSNLTPLLSITFSQGFRKSKKLGHWTSGSGGKKTVRCSEKHWFQKIMLSKENSPKNNSFCATILHPLLVKNSNVTTLLFMAFPQGFRLSKTFVHPTLGSGGKRRLNGISKVNTQTHRQTFEN